GTAVFTLSQNGAVVPCSYSASPTSNTLAAGGGSGSFTASATSGCSLTPSSSQTWLSVSGSGTTISYSAGANPNTTARSATVSVGGTAVFTLNQSGTSVDYPPTVALTYPTSGATVGGTVTLSANASDSSDATPVAKVNFYAAGNLVGTATAAPYSISYNTT